MNILLFQSLFVIFAASISNRAMLFSTSSLLSVPKTKIGQAPQKGTKSLSHKNTGKVLQPIKQAPRVVKELSEEDKIIQAAERYHQQISGKKTDVTTNPKTGNAIVGAQSGTHLEKSGTERAVVNPRAGIISGRPKTEKPIPKTKAEIAAEKKSKLSNKTPVLTFTEMQSSTDEPNPNANIFTGNPGMYQADGDTLNFWSLSSLPIDTIPKKITLVEQPGKPYGFVGKPVKAAGQDWTFFVIIIGWTIFASLRFGFSKYMVQVFQSVFNFSMSSRLYREQGYNNNFGLFRLNLIFFLFLPFPIYLIAKDNGVSLMGFSGIELYLIVLVVVNAYFMVKILLYKILGSIFSQRETTGELVFNMMLYNNVLGLLLLPVSTIHSLVPAFGVFSLFIVPALIAVFYLMSLVRSLYFGTRAGISIFYLILYLCTLEILPILLVAKLAAGQ